MLKQLADMVVADVRKRVSEGDCPTTPAHSVRQMGEELLHSWLLNTELECSGASLSAIEKIAIGGDVLELADLLTVLRQASADRAAVAELVEENEALRKRGVEAIIAYHTAICLPKGAVPVASLYDPILATEIERKFESIRKDTLSRHQAGLEKGEG